MNLVRTSIAALSVCAALGWSAESRAQSGTGDTDKSGDPKSTTTKKTTKTTTKKTTEAKGATGQPASGSTGSGTSGSGSAGSSNTSGSGSGTGSSTTGSGSGTSGSTTSGTTTSGSSSSDPSGSTGSGSMGSGTTGTGTGTSGMGTGTMGTSPYDTSGSTTTLGQGQPQGAYGTQNQGVYGQPGMGAPGQATMPAPGPTTSTTQTTSGLYDPAISGSDREGTSKIRPNRPLLITGSAIFLGSYAATAIQGAVSPLDADRKNLIPLVGPWINMSERPCNLSDDCSTKENVNNVLLIGSGVAQGAGIAIALLSLVVPETKERSSVTAKVEPPKPTFRVTPAKMGQDGAGAFAMGTF